MNAGIRVFAVIFAICFLGAMIGFSYNAYKKKKAETCSRKISKMEDKIIHYLPLRKSVEFWQKMVKDLAAMNKECSAYQKTDRLYLMAIAHSEIGNRYLTEEWCKRTPNCYPLKQLRNARRHYLMSLTTLRNMRGKKNLKLIKMVKTRISLINLALSGYKGTSL